MGLDVWFRELRAPFLILPLLSVPVGVAVAWRNGFFNPFDAVLTLIGALCLHAAVNILNDYFDYRSGIDIATKPTPFSGGSRILPNSELTPNQVLTYGLFFLMTGSTIGFYFISKFALDPLLAALVLAGVVSIVGYSSLFSCWGLGEFVVGLNFGPLLVLGTYYVQARAVSVEPLLIGSVLGILVACILYINEFPDYDADKAGGRYHLVVRLGREGAARAFRYILASAYLLIIAGVALGVTPPLTLIALLTIPKARGAVKCLEANYDKVVEMIPGMASMVMSTLFTGVLLFVAYLAHGFLF